MTGKRSEESKGGGGSEDGGYSKKGTNLDDIIFIYESWTPV